MSFFGWRLRLGGLITRLRIAAPGGWDTAFGDDWDHSFGSTWDTSFGS